MWMLRGGSAWPWRPQPCMASSGPILSLWTATSWALDVTSLGFHWRAGFCEWNKNGLLEVLFGRHNIFNCWWVKECEPPPIGTCLPVLTCVEWCGLMNVGCSCSNGCEWNGMKHILHICFGIQVKPGEDHVKTQLQIKEQIPTSQHSSLCWPQNGALGRTISTKGELVHVCPPSTKKTECNSTCGGGCILPWVVALCWYETPVTRIASANRHGTLSEPRQKQRRLRMLWMLG